MRRSRVVPGQSVAGVHAVVSVARCPCKFRAMDPATGGLVTPSRSGRSNGADGADARLADVFVVHATKRVLDRCGGPSPSVDRPSTAALGDWYATALFWRPQVALFVNEKTRLPVFVSLAPAATVVDRFVVALDSVLDAHGIDPRFVDAERTEMAEHRLAKTASRSVLGTMNDFTHLAEAYRDQERELDLLALSLWLAGTPCGPLRDRSGFPDLELKAMAERVLGGR